MVLISQHLLLYKNKHRALSLSVLICQGGRAMWGHREKSATYKPESESAVPSFLSLPATHLLSHPSRSSCSTELSFLWCAATSYLLCVWYCIYVNATVSVLPPLSYSCCAHMSILSVYLWIPVLQTDSSVPFFLDICFSLSDLLPSVWHSLSIHVSANGTVSLHSMTV